MKVRHRSGYRQVAQIILEECGIHVGAQLTDLDVRHRERLEKSLEDQQRRPSSYKLPQGAKRPTDPLRWYFDMLQRHAKL